MATKMKDKRGANFHLVPNIYIDEYARICGPKATAIYLSLCRHADRGGKSFPGIRRLMEQHGIRSNNTVIKAIQELEKCNIVDVERGGVNDKKQRVNNIYILNAPSSWTKPSAENAHGAKCKKTQKPGAKNSEKPGAVSAPEQDTVEQDTEKDLATHSVADVKKPDPVNQIMQVYYDTGVNVAIQFQNKTQRAAAQWLIDHMHIILKCPEITDEQRLRNALKMTEIACKMQGHEYTPRITTPLALKNKFGDFTVAYERARKKKVNNEIPGLDRKKNLV
jgi:hypothetical protein